MRQSIPFLILILAGSATQSAAASLADVSSQARTGEELLQRATAAFEAADYKNAAALYAELRAAEPANPAGWFGGGLAAEARGELGSAIKLLARAVELDPKRAAVHLTHGRVLARARVGNSALAAFQRARDLDPAEPNGYLYAALLLRDAASHAEAEALLRAGIARAKPRQEFFDQLGLVLLSQRQPEAALETVDDFLTRYSITPRIELVRGLALAETAASPNQRDVAITSLGRAIAGGEGGAPARIQLADLLIDASRLDEAIVQLSEAAELAPGNPRAHYRLAQALRQAGQSEEAAVALNRFQDLRQQQDNESARTKRLGTTLNTALEHLRANRPAEALEAVEEVLAEAPGHARTLALKAKILFSSGNVAQAHELALAARTADPSMTEHHYLVGLFGYHLEEFEGAEAAINQALAMEPDVGEAHEVAAVIALRLERPAEAVVHFERAIALGIDTEELRRAHALALSAVESQNE